MDPTSLLAQVHSADLSSLNISYWILQTIAMLLTALLLPGLRVSGPLGALLTVVALAFVNSKIWDAALFFSIPDTLSTQALTLLATNGIIFWIVVKLLPGIEIDGVFPALAAPVVFTVVSLLIGRYGQHIDWRELGRRSAVFVQDVRTQLQENQPKGTGATSPRPVTTRVVPE